jgi:hypothetical protein
MARLRGAGNIFCFVSLLINVSFKQAKIFFKESFTTFAMKEQECPKAVVRLFVAVSCNIAAFFKAV